MPFSLHGVKGNLDKSGRATNLFPATVQRRFSDPTSWIALCLLSDWDWLDLGYFDAWQRLARLLSSTFSR